MSVITRGGAIRWRPAVGGRRRRRRRGEPGHY